MREELKFFPSWVAGRLGYADRIKHLFEEFHREKGMRVTHQRQKILDFLLKAHHHVSMDEIYKALKSKGIGKVTVFRALKMLEEARLVDRVNSPDGKPLYEVNFERPHHDHLICISCGTIQEIQWPQVEKIQEKTCKELGFQPTFHRHEIYGLCKWCSGKSKKGNSHE